MKNLAYKFYVPAFCLSLLFAYQPADAQKKTSSKSKTTKSRYASTAAKTPAKKVVSAPVETQASMPAPTAQSPVTAANDNLPKEAAMDSLPPMDGYYKNDIFTNAHAFKYPATNPRDVRFFKRVWRDIDINDPKNSLLNTPNATLADIVFEGVRTGKIVAYEASATNNDSTFARRLNFASAVSRLQDSAMVDQFDKDGNKIGSRMVLNDFNPASVTKFRTKEDIYFDKKRSMVVTRIIGIAPLKAIQASGQTIAEAPVFWLYFPQVRDYFATKDVSDPDHNIYDTSLDDIFVQGKYVSTIVRSTGSVNGKSTNIPNLTSAASAISSVDPAQANAQNAKLVEEKIQSFKDNTWDYKLRTKPVDPKKAKATKAPKKADKSSTKAKEATTTAAVVPKN